MGGGGGGVKVLVRGAIAVCCTVFLGTLFCCSRQWECLEAVDTRVRLNVKRGRGGA